MDEYILDIVINNEAQEDDEGRVIYLSNYVYVNGELIDSNGSPLETVLRYLGYEANVSYS